MGRYCSCLLPRQDSGISQIQVNRRFLPTRIINPLPGFVICNFPPFSLYRKKFGQLQYLENLRKSDYSKKGGQNPELCPICRNALGSA